MRIVLLSIALLFLAFSAQSQVLKSAGVWYFLDVDSMTARPAALPNGTELAYVVGTKTVYYWNRGTSTWTAYGSTFNRDSIYFDASIVGSGTISDPWGVDSTLFATIAAVGDSIAAALMDYVEIADTNDMLSNYPTVGEVNTQLGNYLPILGGTLTGTGGAGFIGFPSQITAPGTPASGLNVYAQGSSFNWKGTDGFGRQITSSPTGGRNYALPDVNGTFALGTGTADRLARWTGTNTQAAGNLSDNATRLQALLPWQFHSWTTAERPSGVNGYVGRNSTTGFQEGYFASQWENYITSTGASANQIPYFLSAGKIAGDAGLTWNNTNKGISIISSATAQSRGLIVRQTNNGIQAAAIQFEKIRGSSAVQNGDIIGAFTLRGYSGSQYVADNALFGGVVTGTVTSSSVPTSIFLNAGSTLGNYTTQLLVHSGGNVGIGNFGVITLGASIVAPSEKLHTIGNILAQGTLKTLSTASGDIDNISFKNTYNAGAKYKITWNDSPGLGTPVAQIYSIFDGSKVDLRIGSLYNSAYNSVDKFHFGGNGRLGIGNTSPQRELHVSGEARITDLTTDTPTRIVGADADGDLGAITVSTGLNLSGSGVLTATGGTGTSRTIPYHNNSGVYTYNTSFKLDTTTTAGTLAKYKLNINNPSNLTGDGDAYQVLATYAGDAAATSGMFTVGDQAATMGATGYKSVMQLYRTGGTFASKSNLSAGTTVGSFAWRGQVNGVSTALGNISLSYLGNGTTSRSSISIQTATSGGMQTGLSIDSVRTISLPAYGLGNKEASGLSKTQSSYIAGFATDGTILDYPIFSLPNGIYSGSGTLSQTTTRARIPDNGNLLFSQTYNTTDSAYIQVINNYDGNREVRGGLTDTTSTGYSTFRFYQDESDEEMGYDFRSLDNTGNTRVLAQGGIIRVIGSNIASMESTGEIRLLGLVTAKQEAYNEVTSTTSPVTLSNTYSDNLINQGGTQASFTFLFPASPEDGQILTLTYNNAITTLTLDGNGETIVGSAVTTAVAGSQRKFKFYTGVGWIKLH